MATLGEFIRKVRDEKQLSLREFARRLQISPAFASDIELGRRFPSDDMLQGIAAVLDSEFTTLRQLDTRVPIDELKRMSDANPTFGTALRVLTERKVEADDLLEWLTQHKRVRR